MQFTNLSKLISESFEYEMRAPRGLHGLADEPLLAGMDAYAIVRAMRDPSRTLDEQGAVLAAVIRCYREAPTTAWSALLLEMVSPMLVATASSFQYVPSSVADEDVEQQVIVEALQAARRMRLPEPPEFTLKRLRDWTISRTARMLLRAARAEMESLDVEDEEEARRLDPEEAFLLEMAHGDTPEAYLAFVYLSKVLRMTAREMAIQMGVSLNSILNRRRRAKRRLQQLHAAKKQASSSERAAA
jgi:DNA-directed RNA polymerase specialized sigma24 family protein